MHRTVAGGAGGGAVQMYTSTLRAVYDDGPSETIVENIYGVVSQA